MSSKYVNYDVEIDTKKCLNRFQPRYSKSQMWLDNEVLKDCNAHYVPRNTGVLCGSGIRGTKIGSGMVRWTAPYSRPCYYLKNRKFNQSKNSKACAFWFEKAKPAHKKAWISGVKKIVEKD